MLVYGQTFCIVMEEQIPSSTPPQQTKQPPVAPGITPEMLMEMKARAREEAVRMTRLQQQQQQISQEEIPVAPPAPMPSFAPLPAPIQPQVVYVRRNLTVAELIVVFAIACGIVAGVQGAWSFVSNVLPRIEIKTK